MRLLKHENVRHNYIRHILDILIETFLIFFNVHVLSKYITYETFNNVNAFPYDSFPSNSYNDFRIIYYNYNISDTRIITQVNEALEIVAFVTTSVISIYLQESLYT